MRFNLPFKGLNSVNSARRAVITSHGQGNKMSNVLEKARIANTSKLKTNARLSKTVINYPRQHNNFITARLDYMFRPINWSSSGPIIL